MAKEIKDKKGYDFKNLKKTTKLNLLFLSIMLLLFAGLMVESGQRHKLARYCQALQEGMEQMEESTHFLEDVILRVSESRDSLQCVIDSLQMR